MTKAQNHSHPILILEVFLMQAHKRTSPYTSGRNKERITTPVPMNNFNITTKVCFKTLATQTTKRHNPTHTRTEARPKHSPKKGTEKGNTSTNKFRYSWNLSTPKGDTKRIPTRDPQGPRFIVRTTTGIYLIIKQIFLKYDHWSESSHHLKPSRRIKYQ